MQIEYQSFSSKLVENFDITDMSHISLREKICISCFALFENELKFLKTILLFPHSLMKCLVSYLMFCRLYFFVSSEICFQIYINLMENRRKYKKRIINSTSRTNYVTFSHSKEIVLLKKFWISVYGIYINVYIGRWHWWEIVEAQFSLCLRVLNYLSCFYVKYKKNLYTMVSKKLRNIFFSLSFLRKKIYNQSNWTQYSFKIDWINIMFFWF